MYCSLYFNKIPYILRLKQFYATKVSKRGSTSCILKSGMSRILQIRLKRYPFTIESQSEFLVRSLQYTGLEMLIPIKLTLILKIALV